MTAFERILVPVDFSPPSKEALRTALTLARPLGASVEVFHAWMRVPGLSATLGADVTKTLAQTARDNMKKLIAGAQIPSGVALSTRVIEGEIWPSIVALSSSCDLIVMGTHGRTGLDRLIMGSTTERVVREAACPVLTVRAAPAAPKLAEEEEEEEEEPRIVRAMVDDGAALRTTLAALIEAGVPAEQISVAMSEDTHDADFAALDGTKAKEAAAASGILAGTVGGILGGLAGIGMVVTTGGFALLVLGPAVGMAAVGGAIGGLLGRNIPDDRAKVLRGQLVEGRRLIAAHVQTKAEVEKVTAVLKANGAEILDL